MYFFSFTRVSELLGQQPCEHIGVAPNRIEHLRRVPVVLGVGGNGGAGRLERVDRAARTRPQLPFLCGFFLLGDPLRRARVAVLIERLLEHSLDCLCI